MKILLSEIENMVPAPELEEAQELVNATQEYDISQVEEGYFHCISRQPDYHVEITIRKDGMAVPVCHCQVFQRSRHCKHTIAALLLLRDYFQRNRSRKKATMGHITDEVLRKMNVTQLRTFLSSYAQSHSLVRAEIMANYLYLTRNPDYHSLFMDIAPVDKYGQVQLNRNSIKTVRSVSSTLLRQASQLLKENALSSAFEILEASIMHLHRLWNKLSQFREQLSVELRTAYRLFESLCSQPMAPRLQQRVIHLALEICDRDSYVFPSGYSPLLALVEPFLLEEKTRKAAFNIVEKKALHAYGQHVQLASLLERWIRLWKLRSANARLQKQLEKLLPQVLLENSQRGMHEDVLYLISIMNEGLYTDPVLKLSLQTGLKSARSITDLPILTDLAQRLSLNHLDKEAWTLLYEKDPSKASEILAKIENRYPPGSNTSADDLLLQGWTLTGDGKKIIHWLEAMDQVEKLMEYDFFFKDQFREEIENAYADYIVSVREAYGGLIARKKLNNIFNHLKDLDLFQSVAVKIKEMEKPKKDTTSSAKPIRGFVFDLDGVLVDTAVHHFQAWRKIMRELGVEIEDEDDQHTRGAGRMESFEYLLNKYHVLLSEGEKLSWAGRKNELYVESISHISPAELLPGALSFLEASRKMGLLLALGSASKNALLVIQKLGIENYFDAVMDGNATKASKPDPEIFLKASAALGLDPAEVVVFEDAVKGVQAALAAGCYVVGIGDSGILTAAPIVISGLDQSTPEEIIRQLT
jgi:beta-phosphoglucomutase